MSEQQSAESVASPLTIMEGETVTGFALRRILHDAWVAGHDTACAVSLHPCWHHESPHADRAYSSEGLRG